MHLKPHESKKSRAQKIGEITELITNLQKEVSRQLSKNNPMIAHHVLTYGYVPLWVLVNTLTLGTISVFYSYMVQRDQNQVGRKFGLKPDELTPILFILSIYRNACAHDERFYSLKSINRDGRPNMIKSTTIHSKLAIPKNTCGNYIYGKNDLFAIVIVLKLMLSSKSFSRFQTLIEGELENLDSQLVTISIRDVMKTMGFPENWSTIGCL